MCRIRSSRAHPGSITAWRVAGAGIPWIGMQSGKWDGEKKDGSWDFCAAQSGHTARENGFFYQGCVDPKAM